ncbi:hypothetical protein [Clostridium sp. DJ247]|uniref:hypothetical protein n=1 Tax=Clostridium sp. DJ247 TaxID=2726188 RepID=UPI001623C517|nr:hypothetical protein [Clostridium sp. DJ247]MBC2582561.1 hypothetical protein [Clostridium sp. DJ247]
MEQNFYILRKDYDKNYARAIYEKNYTKRHICELCGGIRVEILSNLKISFKGKKEADYYSIPQHSIINEKMYNVLKEANITGFDVADINVVGCYDNRGNEIKFNTNGLKEMIVKGRCGYLRNIDGTLIDKCEKCGRHDYSKEYRVNGLSVNLDEWDRSDIFCFENLRGLPIVTEKVKNILEKAKIKNITFQNIKEFKFVD